MEVAYSCFAFPVREERVLGLLPIYYAAPKPAFWVTFLPFIVGDSLRQVTKCIKCL